MASRMAERSSASVKPTLKLLSRAFQASSAAVSTARADGVRVCPWPHSTPAKPTTSSAADVVSSVSRWMASPLDVQEDDQQTEQGEAQQGEALPQEPSQAAEEGGEREGPHSRFLGARLPFQADEQPESQRQPESRESLLVGPINGGDRGIRRQHDGNHAAKGVPR